MISVTKSFQTSYARLFSSLNVSQNSSANLVKSFIQIQLPLELQRKVKGVHLDAIGEYFKGSNAVKSNSLIISTSNLRFVTGNRREFKFLTNVIGSKLGAVAELISPDDFVNLSMGFTKMLSSDDETKLLLAAVNSKLLQDSQLKLSSEQFSLFVKSMCQLSSKDKVVADLLATVLSKLDSSKSLNGSEISNVLFGLHNMSNNCKSVTNLLALITKELKLLNSSNSSGINVSDALYGLASMVWSDNAANNQVLTELLAELTGSVKRNTVPLSSDAICASIYGMQNIFEEGSTPRMAGLELFRAFVESSKSSLTAVNNSVSPRQLGNALYSLKSFAHWNEANTVEPVIAFIDNSFKQLFKDNKRRLFANSDKGNTSLQNVKDVAYLLQCTNVLLMNNAAYFPRKNPNLGAYADIFVEDTYDNIPSKLNSKLKSILTSSCKVLDSFMNTNNDCKHVPYSVVLPIQESTANAFVSVLRETKCKPKINHHAYVHGIACDTLIHGNFDYVFNLQLQNASYSSKRNSYLLADQYELYRDKVLRYYGLKIIHVSDKEFSELASDPTTLACTIRDVLFDAVQEDIKEHSYSTFEEESDTNDEIMKQIAEKKKLWLSGGGVSASAAEAKAGPTKATVGGGKAAPKAAAAPKKK